MLARVFSLCLGGLLGLGLLAAEAGPETTVEGAADAAAAESATVAEGDAAVGTEVGSPAAVGMGDDAAVVGGEAPPAVQPPGGGDLRIPPGVERSTIANELIELELSNYRASIANFSLRDMHPLVLPDWRRPEVASRNYPDSKKEAHKRSLGVLSLVNNPGSPIGWPLTDMHNYLSNLGLKEKADGAAEPYWTRVGQSAEAIDYEHLNNERGLRYHLHYQLDPERPTVHVSLRVTNEGSAQVDLQPLGLVAVNGIHQDDPTHEDYDLAVVACFGGGEQRRFEYWGMPGQDKQQVVVDPANEQPNLDPSQLRYVGLKSRFFAAWFSPGTLRVERAGAAQAAEPVEEEGISVAEKLSRGPVTRAPTGAAGYSLQATVFGYGQQVAEDVTRQGALYISFADASQAGDLWQLRPGDRFEADWTLTIASVRDEHLDLLTPAEQQIEYTDWWYRFFRMLVWPINALLELLVGIFQIYGLALIALVLIIKGALHRINVKTQTSMMKMQKVGPELKRIQEQYKSDRQTLAMKQMELFKREGVNPVGGCLPMLLQMPIFVALYQTFRHSADMRGQGFLWIQDLTLPDQLIPLFWGITLNPLPLLYIAIMVVMGFVNKPKDTSQMTDQARQMTGMMRWMPIFFGFIFYNMPAGLVLYFTCSALFSFVEMRYIRKKLNMDGAGLVTM